MTAPLGERTVDIGGYPEVVHIGRDGWLFLVGGTNDVLGQYRSGGLPEPHLDYWRRLHEQRQARCASLGATYVSTVVPEKVAIYDNKLDGIELDISASPSAQIANIMSRSSARACHVDLLTPFRHERERVQLYLKTDSHWTYAGCYFAYTEICGRVAARPRVSLAAPGPRHVETVIGDLGAKLDPPFGETAERQVCAPVAARIYANHLVHHFEAAGSAHSSGTASHVVYRLDAEDADSRTIVVFGDSYTGHKHDAEAGRLIWFLAETFREVHFVWANTLDYGYVEKIKPDIVIAEIAERFMIQLPLVEFDLREYERLEFERKILC